jgi:hypothetical protein
MLLWDDRHLTAQQRAKIRAVLTGAGRNADAMLLDVHSPARCSEGTVCVSVLASAIGPHEVQAPKACFVEPNGRHHWVHV